MTTSITLEECNMPILIAFGLTLFAGLSTGIGSSLAFFCKKTIKVQEKLIEILNSNYN